MKTLIGVYKATVRVMSGDPKAGGILGTGRDFDHWYSFDPIPWRRDDRPTGDTWYVTGGESPIEIILPDGAELVEIETFGRRLISSETCLAVAYLDEVSADAVPTEIRLADGRLVGARQALHFAAYGREGFAPLPVRPPAVPRSAPARVPTTEELWGPINPAPEQEVEPLPRSRKPRSRKSNAVAGGPSLGF